MRKPASSVASGAVAGGSACATTGCSTSADSVTGTRVGAVMKAGRPTMGCSSVTGLTRLRLPNRLAVARTLVAPVAEVAIVVVTARPLAAGGVAAILPRDEAILGSILPVAILSLALLPLALLPLAILALALLSLALLAATVLSVAILRAITILAVAFVLAAAILLLRIPVLAVGVRLAWPVVLAIVLLRAIRIMAVRGLAAVAGFVGLPIVEGPLVARLVGLRLRLLRGLLRRRGHLLGRRGEAVGQALEIVVAVVVGLDLFAGLALVAELRLLLRQLRGSDEPEVVLGMLEIALRHHRIPRRLRVAGELKVLLADVVSRPPDLDVRPVRLVGPSQRIGTPAIAAAVVVVVATAHTLVLARSHR